MDEPLHPAAGGAEKGRRKAKRTRGPKAEAQKRAPRPEAAKRMRVPAADVIDAGPDPGSPEHGPRHTTMPFPVVGIGASAGGLSAFEAFLGALAKTDGGARMAYVFVQHLDPSHKSLLPDIVQKYTDLPAHSVEDGMLVERGNIYVIPPNKNMALVAGRLHLMERDTSTRLNLPIDFFFRSLAEDQGDNAVGIILSGTGSDGTSGLRTIKGEGGLTVVQDPDTAEYDGMPRSAVSTELIDLVLPVEEMPAQVAAFVDRTVHLATKKGARPARQEIDDASLTRALILLRNSTGHDFTAYKPTTVRRRVERRMAVQQMSSIDDYVRYLQTSPAELDVLFRELLIRVTHFFRDPASFEALEREVVPQLLAEAEGRELRVWVPACSTGEEAYSLAILLREQIEKVEDQPPVQVFGSDIDADAVEQARHGVYPRNIAADVSPERLRRFFGEDGEAYHVTKTIRDMVVFAKQDIAKDPPFSHLDLVSCRNMLIYMTGELQQQVVQILHYALRPGGFLLLGASETVGGSSSLFELVDPKWKIYRRRPDSVSHPLLQRTSGPFGGARPHARPVAEAMPASLEKTAERILLEDYSPAGVIINQDFDILYVHGRTGRFLEPARGQASMNLLRMAREGLRLEISAGVRAVLTDRKPVRYEGVQIRTNGERTRVDLIVQPIERTDLPGPLVMVIFQEAPAVAAGAPGAPASGVTEADQRIVELERELSAKDERLRAAVEELQSSNEELRSTNEELQSINEELQSSNEELETSKEELQSVNEELSTVNTELQQRNQELSSAHNDLVNLLSSTGIGTIFVDNDMRVLRFTPAVRRLINLIPSDVGRPVGDIVSRLKGHERLLDDVKIVLQTLESRESAFQARDDLWYQVRVQPYRTTRNMIEGAVLTFVDITDEHGRSEQLEQADSAIARAGDFTEALVGGLDRPLLVVTETLTVRQATDAFLDRFGLARHDVIGRPLAALGETPWDVGGLCDPAAGELPGPAVWTTRVDLLGRGQRTVRVHLGPGTAGEDRLCLLILDDCDEAAAGDGATADRDATG